MLIPLFVVITSIWVYFDAKKIGVKRGQMKGIEYARNNFRFSLLEYRPMKDDDKTIIKRENHWKDVLLTRGDYGYNKS